MQGLIPKLYHLLSIENVIASLKRGVKGKQRMQRGGKVAVVWWSSHRLVGGSSLGDG